MQVATTPYEGHERRQTRSEFVSEALRLQLAAVAERHNIDMLVLADDGGLLWAAAYPTGGISLAARAAHAVEPGRGDFVVLIPQPDPVVARRVRVGAAQLYLVAQASGHATRRCRRALVEATRGVRRILGSLIN